MKEKKVCIWDVIFTKSAAITLVLICIMSGCRQEIVYVKSPAPMSLTLTQSPESGAWTNGSVVITAASSTSIKEAKWLKGQVSVKEIFASGTDIINTSFQVRENGIYSVGVMDNEGRRELETIEIKNIDKTFPPSPLKFAAEYKLNEKKIILRWAELSDSGSGLKAVNLRYTVNRADEKIETIAPGCGIFELHDVEPQNPPDAYAFFLRAIDRAGNESDEVKSGLNPSERAEISGISVSRKKIDKDDPDKKIVLTLTGSNLTRAEEISIVEPEMGTISFTEITDSEARVEFSLPDEIKKYNFKVAVKHAGVSSALFIEELETQVQVCESCKITKMRITKQDDSQFEMDSYGSLMVEAAEGLEMKIVLEGENFDIEGLKAGVNFNGTDLEGKATADGTELHIENIFIPEAAGSYHIRAQIKKPYETVYSQVHDSSGVSGYRPMILRILGEVVLNELRLSGYDPSLEGSEGWLIIKGEDLDQLAEYELTHIISYLGGSITSACLRDNRTIEAVYTIPDLYDDSIIDKIEILTLGGKTVSSVLHTLKIEKNNSGKYIVKGAYSIPFDGNPRIPSYIDKIDAAAFKGCTDIKNINLSICTNLTSIAGGAFKSCTGLVSVRFPVSLKEIKGSLVEGAFRDCIKLQVADLSSCTELFSIGSGAFKGCRELNSVSIPPSLEKIGKEAFKNCTKLTAAVFSDTEGWAVYDDLHYKKKYADITSSDLSDSGKAAEYLRSTYDNKYWKKN